MDSAILHLNIVGFCAGVERLRDSSLRGRPLIVAPPLPQARILDLSPDAWQEGVRRFMTVAQARRHCAGLRIVPPDPDRYQRAMQYCLRQAGQYSPLVEEADRPGHLYLDVTGTHRLFGPPPDIGWRLRKQLRQDPGLDPVWTVAPNRLLARVAARLVKPAGEYVVAAGEEAEFLAPLDLALLPGVGRVTRQRLREAGIRTIGQAARLSRQELFTLTGRIRSTLYLNLRGIDPEPVRPPAAPRSCFQTSRILDTDTNQDQAVHAVLLDLIRQSGRWLRGRALACRSLTLTLEYCDRIRASRAIRVRMPVNLDQDLEQMGERALRAAWRRRVRIRKLTLECAVLVRPAHQLSLFACMEEKKRKSSALNSALDALHERFGPAVIRRGRMIQ